MAPQVRDTIGMSIPHVDALGLLNPEHLVPIFLLLILEQLDLKPLLEKLNMLEDLKLKISTVVWMTHDDNSCRVQA